MDHITGDKIPKSFVFSRGKLPGPLRQLQMDLRKLMLPFTALKLKVSALEFYGKFYKELISTSVKVARIITWKNNLSSSINKLKIIIKVCNNEGTEVFN